MEELPVGRQGSRHEARRPLAATTLAGHDAKRHSIARLQRRLKFLQVVRRVDRLLVDRDDDIALVELDVLGEGIRIYGNDLDTALRLQPERLTPRLAEVLDHHAEAGHTG